jgi:hypothetical protein
LKKNNAPPRTVLFEPRRIFAFASRLISGALLMMLNSKFTSIMSSRTENWKHNNQQLEH